jgi:hypothetical protein
VSCPLEKKTLSVILRNSGRSTLHPYKIMGGSPEGVMRMNKFWKGLWLVVQWILIGLLILFVAVGVLFTLNRYLPAGDQVTVEVLLGLAAIVLSLTFKFLPGLRTKFAVIGSGNKAVVNLVAVTIMAVIVYVLTCYRLIALTGVECTKLSMVSMAKDIFWVLVANQMTHIATVKPADVLNAEMNASVEAPF